jgi:ABC-type lipoprotein release transport system permease subunit
MNIQEIKECIRLADLEGAKEVEVYVKDLVRLVNVLEQMTKEKQHADKLCQDWEYRYSSLLASSLSEKRDTLSLGSYLSLKA